MPRTAAAEAVFFAAEVVKMLSIAPLPNQFLHRVRTENRDDLAPDSADATMRAFFASPDVAFLHLRFPTYGCFACRVDRAVTSGSAQ